MPYVLTNDKNWLMYNAAKQFTSTPDVKQAQQFATAARAENARYNLPKPLKNLGYHVQFVGMADAEPVDIDADIDPIELHDGIETIGAMLDLHKQCASQQQWLENRLCETQSKICDIEHAIEFYNYNARDGYKMYKRLKELRLERRKYKDALLICEIMAGAFAAVDWAELDARLPNLANRAYKPRFYPELFENNA